MGLIPGWGAKILCASWLIYEDQKQYCNKFNKDFGKYLHFKNLKKKRIIINEAYDRGIQVDYKSTQWKRDVERSQEVVSSKVNLGGQTHFQREEEKGPSQWRWQ